MPLTTSKVQTFKNSRDPDEKWIYGKIFGYNDPEERERAKIRMYRLARSKQIKLQHGL